MGSGLRAEIDSNERSGSVPIHPKTHLQFPLRDSKSINSDGRSCGNDAVFTCKPGGGETLANMLNSTVEFINRSILILTPKVCLFFFTCPFLSA